MATARYAWGIDIGNRALKAVKLVRDGDRYRVDDFELIEHETVLSQAGDNKESLMQAALANFIQRHPMKGGGVVGVGVSGQSSFARFIKLPPVEPKKIPEIVRFEAIQQIPFPLEDVEWSYQLFQAADNPDVEVGIFAMRKELVNQHIKYFTDFDLNVTAVQMNPLAVYNALYHDGKFSGTTMIIDLGAENTDLIIADNDSIWMRSIPIGGNNFTETLVKAFKLPFSKAEDLKRNAASSKYARQIFQAMRPIFADLVAEIQRSNGFYASVHRDSRIKKAIALGGTFKLPGLQKYLQQNLQMDVERLDSIVAGAPSDAKLAPTFNENVLSIVSAYGLALQAFGDTKITSSLLPSAIRREKMWKEKTKWFAAAAALFVVGTAIPAGLYTFQNFQFQNANSQHAAEIASVEREAKQLDAQWTSDVESGGGTDRTLIANLRGMDSYRTVWRDLLVDVRGALPTPPKELLSGDPTEIKKLPRNKRKIVLIDNITSSYRDNLGAILSDPDFRRYSDPAVTGPTDAAPAAQPGGDGGYASPGQEILLRPGQSAAPPPPPPPPVEGAPADSGAKRGFLLTIRCTSPNDDALSLVNDVLVANLKSIRPDAKQPKRAYAIEKCEIVSATPLKSDQAKLNRLKQAFDAASRSQGVGMPGAATGGEGNPGGKFGGSGQGMEDQGMVAPGGAPSTLNDDRAYKDRITEESMLDDWEITLLVAVTIDPAMFVPPPPAETPPQANAN